MCKSICKDDVNVTAQQLGVKVGDKFVVLSREASYGGQQHCSYFNVGDIVTLIEDDNTYCPKFVNQNGEEAYESFACLARHEAKEMKFTVGDVVVCVDAEDQQMGLVEGQEYEVVSVFDDDGEVFVRVVGIGASLSSTRFKIKEEAKMSEYEQAQSTAPTLWNAYKDVLNTEALDALAQVILDKNVHVYDSKTSINCAFKGGHTKQGHEFWSDVSVGLYNKDVEEQEQQSPISLGDLLREKLGYTEYTQQPVQTATSYVSEESTPSASDFLLRAAQLQEERGKQYDAEENKERSMGKTIIAFNAITGHSLSESEGWLLLQLLKDVRQWAKDTYHQDSAEDCIAYAALKAEALASGK